MGLVVLLARPFFAIWSRALVNLSITPSLSSLVRWRSYRYVLRQSLGFFQDDYAGRISQKVMQTGMALRESVVNVIDGVWFLLVYLIGTIALFIGFDWRLMLPLVGWVIAYGAVIVTLVPPVRERSIAMSEANSGLTGRVVDGFTNILSVKLFAHAEREEAFGRQAFERQLEASRAMNRTITTMTAALTLLNSVFIFVAAALSIWLWTKGEITLGAVAASNALTLRLNQMSGWVLRSITSLFESTGTIENGMELLSRPNTLVDPPGAEPLIVTEGAIAFENVTFRYGAGNHVIRDLSLFIRPGEKVGLVGPSGAGKSTLVNLLLRFYSLEQGRILIDGQDIAGVTQDSLRAAIGMVTQDTSLLHRSVSENIRYGRPDADEAAIRDGRRGCARRPLHRRADRSARAERLCRARRRARDQALRRAAAADRHRARHPEGRADPDPRRGDGGARLGSGGRDPGQPQGPDAGQDGDRHRAPSFDDRRARPAGGGGRGQDRRGRDARGAASRSRALCPALGAAVRRFPARQRSAAQDRLIRHLHRP